MNIPQVDLQDIKGRLSRIEHRIDNLELTLDDRIELTMRRRLDMRGHHGRETSAWVIGIVSFGLFVLFSLVNVAFQVWG